MLSSVEHEKTFITARTGNIFSQLVPYAGYQLNYCNLFYKSVSDKMGLDATKSIFEVSNKARLIPVSSATETS